MRTPLANDAYAFEWFEHLDAERTHLLAHPVVTECIRGAHCDLLVPAPQGREAIRNSEIWIHTHAGDEEDISGAVVRIEIRTVVGVSVRAGDVSHRQWNLVNREFVERYGHWESSVVSGTIDRDTRSGPG
jgi:hypothetical protein